MSTSEYIYEEERKLNNTIIRYFGSFNGKIIIYNLVFIFEIFLFSIYI